MRAWLLLLPIDDVVELTVIPVPIRARCRCEGVSSVYPVVGVRDDEESPLAIPTSVVSYVSVLCMMLM